MAAPAAKKFVDVVSLVLPFGRRRLFPRAIEGVELSAALAMLAHLGFFRYNALKHRQRFAAQTYSATRSVPAADVASASSCSNHSDGRPTITGGR